MTEIQFGLQFPDSLPLPPGTKVDKHVCVSWPRVLLEIAPSPRTRRAAHEEIDRQIALASPQPSDSLWLMYSEARLENDEWCADAIRVRWPSHSEYSGWRMMYVGGTSHS